jgi:hypothetical protein
VLSAGSWDIVQATCIVTVIDSIRTSSWGLSPGCVDALDRVDDVHPGGDLAEDGVLAVEPGAAPVVTMKNCEPFVFDRRSPSRGHRVRSCGR